MSVTGIFGSGCGSNQIQSQYQLTSSQFQQLGQDLSAGNLTSAQSDFTILQQTLGQTTSTSSAGSASSLSNPLAQAFQQLSSDLKSGNITAAQKDYSTLQQDLRSLSTHRHHGHHLPPGFDFLTMGTSGSNSSSSSNTAQTSAQQTYSALAQQLQQYALGNVSTSTGVVPNPISLMA